MKLECCFCRAPLYLDLSDDEKAMKELKFAQRMECAKNPNPEEEKKVHNFNRLG